MDWVSQNRYMALYVIDVSERGLKLSRAAEEIRDTFGKDISASTLAKSLEKLLEMDLVKKDENKVYYLDDEASRVTAHLDEVYHIVQKSGDVAQR